MSRKHEFEKLKMYLRQRHLDKIFSLHGQEPIDTLNDIKTYERTSDLSLTHRLALDRLRFYVLRISDDPGMETQKIDATIRWINICLSGDPAVDYFFDYYHLDRDTEVDRIWQKFNCQDNSFTLTPATVEYIADSKERNKLRRHLIQEWYLIRYDFPNSYHLLKSLFSSADSMGWAQFLRRFIITLFIMLILAVLSWINSPHNSWFSSLSWDWFGGVGKICLFTTVLFLIEVLAITVLFTPLLRALVLPRMFTGIVVGYILLLSSDALVSFSINTTFLNSIQVFLAAAALSFWFTFWEVTRRIGHGDTTERLKRSAYFFLISLGQSIVIGLFVIDLFSFIFSDHLHSTESVAFIGPWGGAIYLQPMLVFITLAMGLGIILQLIWQEQPVSRQW